MHIVLTPHRLLPRLHPAHPRNPLLRPRKYLLRCVLRNSAPFCDERLELGVAVRGLDAEGLLGRVEVGAEGRDARLEGSLLFLEVCYDGVALE